MKKLKWLDTDRRRLGIKIVGISFICAAYLIMNLGIFSVDYEVRAFFLLIALGFIFLSFGLRNEHWILRTFFELSLYNLLDELSGNACKSNYFEIIGALILLIYNWKTWKVLS